MFTLINCEGGKEVLVGSFPTKIEAQQMFRDRNKHLFDKKYAQQNNLESASTFDLIFDRDGHFVDPMK